MAFRFTADATHRWTWSSVSLRRCRVRQRHLGTPLLVLLSFAAELGWAFFGSLGLGLGTRGGAVSGSAPFVWLAVAVAIAALAGLAAWLAPPATERDR